MDVDGFIVKRLLRSRIYTISSMVHIEHIAHLNVDGSEESLILFLELFLIENLNCEHALVGDRSVVVQTSKESAQREKKDGDPLARH